MVLSPGTACFSFEVSKLFADLRGSSASAPIQFSWDAKDKVDVGLVRVYI